MSSLSTIGIFILKSQTQIDAKDGSLAIIPGVKAEDDDPCVTLQYLTPGVVNIPVCT